MHFDKKYLYSKSHVLYQGKKVFYQGAAKCAGNGEKFEDKWFFMKYDIFPDWFHIFILSSWK